ncbi:MAG: prepilin-type N-terminal cleavage/methylation domain-containing protein [Candidatus Korobacteraceae bacterium]
MLAKHGAATSNANTPSRRQFRFRGSPSRGFTLLELIVTLAVFSVLGLAAVMVSSQSARVSITQQAQSTLNVAVRNATAQIETDVINSGTGYFPTYNIPGAPMGIVVSHVGPGLDTLTILSFSPTIIAHPTSNVNTTSGTITVAPIAPMTATTLQQGYSVGNEIMMLSATNLNADGWPTVTTFPITAVGACSSCTSFTLSYTPNTTPASPSTGAWAADPLYVSSTYATDAQGNPVLGTSFTASDWVLNTSSIVYQISGNQLTRTVNNGTVSTLGAVMDNNVIGFQVGVELYNTTNTSTFTYATSATGPIVANPRDIRAIRISFITQTAANAVSPSIDEGTTVIINPRNLSMHDN